MTEIRGSAEPLRILHLSDPHLLGDGRQHYDRVDTTAALRRVLDRAAAVGSIDLVAATGDLSDDGSESSYRLLHELLEPWAAARGAQTAYLMGNHDQPAGFEAVLGDREGLTTVAGRRIIRLDTSVPGAGYGDLVDQQLARLRSVLAEPAEHGSVVLLHHPPVPAVTPLLQALQLRNPAVLLEICAAGDVKAILGGHYHHPLAGRAGGVEVFVAPGIANTTDVIAPAGHEIARTGSGFALLEIPAAAAESVRWLPIAVAGPEDGQIIFDLPPGRVRQIAADYGLPR